MSFSTFDNDRANARECYSGGTSPRIHGEWSNYGGWTENWSIYFAEFMKNFADLSHVIYCTGYAYNFDFVDRLVVFHQPIKINQSTSSSTIPLTIDTNCITPLYQHMIHPSHPRGLFFIGIPSTVVPFPLFDLQARVASKLIGGDVKIPGWWLIDWLIDFQAIYTPGKTKIWNGANRVECVNIIRIKWATFNGHIWMICAN